MSDEKKTVEGLMEKGFTPSSSGREIALEGFTPTAGKLGTPPTQGSAVTAPAVRAKD